MPTTLLTQVASFESLKTAWDNLNKTNRQSHGLSGESIEDFEQNLIDKLHSISKQLLEGKYKFRPNRAVTIPKPNSAKERPLQIPEISDRIVLKAIAIKLEEIFSPTISKSAGYSFAYQKKLGAKDAISKISEHIKNSLNYSLEADLINFFGTVDKNELLSNYIFPHLPDDTINNLITAGLSQEIGGLDKLTKVQQTYFVDVEKGIPQGNPLSPLLSNIYLSPFDLHLISKCFNLVRYADDFVILCDSQANCELAYKECENILGTLGLKIHSLEKGIKTKIINLRTDPLTFLSVTFNNGDVYPSLENFNRLKSKIRTICNGDQDYHIVALLRKLINVQEGWISAFIYTNLNRYNKELDSFIDRHLFLALRKYDWKFQVKSIGKTPKQFAQKGESRDCLSSKQRLNSGIPFTEHLIDRKRRSQST